MDETKEIKIKTVRIIGGSLDGQFIEINKNAKKFSTSFLPDIGQGGFQIEEYDQSKDLEDVFVFSGVFQK